MQIDTVTNLKKIMLEIVIEARNAAISEAVKVKRILPFQLRRMVGPFIFMDHAGPLADIPVNPSTLDVLPHPHIGLSTVSYVFAGQVTHRDSLGVEQVIRPGEVNWMTAGRGIAHSERFEDPAALAGGLEMIQTWVALPEKEEESAPSFKNYKPQELPIFTEKGVWMRLIAGCLWITECGKNKLTTVLPACDPAGRGPTRTS
jgi:redox-sensitive bicupin YhaK (pirin superfamily)